MLDKESLKSEGYDSSTIKNIIKEAKKEYSELAKENTPKDFHVKRKGNILFCGDDDLIKTVLEAIKDIKR